MIPRLHKRGTSFKGACTYILHDPGQNTDDRVLWAETVNILSGPEKAWAEMFEVVRDQAELKQRSGHEARGRKNTKPVLHYSLSWAPGEQPSAEHMRETALDSLKALKLDRHQALIAAHCDKEHMHLHIVVNTIHPETGLTAPLKYTKAALSLWAEAYERQHGIHCEQRLHNNAVRMENAAAMLSAGDCLRPKERPSLPEVPGKRRGPHRERWYERKDILDRMKRLRAEMDVGHKAVRNTTWQRHKAERDELDRDCRAACDRTRGYVEDRYRPRWRDLYRAQKKEIRTIELHGTHPFERAVFVFRNSERLGHGRPLSFRQKVRLILDQGKLLDRLDAVHQKERRALAQAEKSEKATMVEPIMVRHKERFLALRARQSAERKHERDAQFADTRNISFAQARASFRQDPYIHGAPRSVFKRDQDMPPRERAPSAEEMKREIEAWRLKHPGRDFGREM
jgi:hypothetical protein